MRFAHYMIHVRDLERAIAFYTAALGYHVAEIHNYAGTVLAYLRGQDSDVEIELIQPAAWTFRTHPETGRSHIAFTVDDLEAEHARIMRLGARPDSVASYEANGVLQTRYFYFNDPDGHQIEFLESRGRYARKERST